MATAVDIAWFAGLFEGEGCIKIQQRPGHWSVGLAVGMTDKDIIDSVQVMFGGQVYPKEDKRPNRKTVYTWVLGKSDLVIDLLEQILPYLGVRRSEQAERALHVARRISPNTGVASIQHGTIAGHSKERYYGMTPCAECTLAYHRYHAEYRAKKRAS